MESNCEKRIISYVEFREKFKPVFEMPFDDFYEDLGEITLVEPDNNGTVVITGDFEVPFDCSYVINGNLVVDGCISMYCDEGVGNFLFIAGNVKAKVISLNGFVSMHIKGNADITDGIVGVDGDDGGYLTIYGDTASKVVLNCTYFNMDFKGVVDAVVIDTSRGETPYDYDKKTVKHVVLIELMVQYDPEYDEDDDYYDFEYQDAAKYIVQGKNILREGIVKKTKIKSKYKNINI